MSTIEISGDCAPAEARIIRPHAFAQLRALWHAWHAHRAQKRSLARLEQLDARLLRDMGFEPAGIYGARRDTIGEIHGDAWRGLDR
jgi:uncharacterized protein YjiS (DUF1127 family)